MGVLSGLKPENVFRYFEEITKIPHGSGNMEAISDYVVNEGKKLGCEAWKDEACNAVILGKASKGYENAPVVMLQGHLDMVAERLPGSDFDFKKDPLKLFLEGDLIGAEGTTLGGDDGIAVAMMLAILSDPEILHPALECVFTVDEEIGLIGASKMDFSFSKAKYLINLDSEEEGCFLVSCSGGGRFDASFPIERKVARGNLYKINVSSSLGGHSGGEIQKDRPNTNIVMGQLLYDLRALYPDLSLVSFEGGKFDNAIPVLTVAEAVSADDIDISGFTASYFEEYAGTDSVLTVSLEKLEENAVRDAFSDALLDRVLFYFEQVPNGVIAMNHGFDGVAETSLNLGIVKTCDNAFTVSHSVRSAIGTKKDRLLHRLTNLANKCGAETDIHGLYPGWNYKRDSRLRDLMVEIWNRDFAADSRKAEIVATHGGVECGLILDKCPGLDIVSLGPDMRDIHTTSERLSIPSVARVYAFLLKVLREMQD